MLETCAEPLCQFRGLTDPFAWANQIGDAFYPAVRGAEVGIGAECYAIDLEKHKNKTVIPV